VTNLNSKIEWTDATLNVVTGCTKVSSGCDHCYAEKITERFHGKGSFAQVKLHEDRLDAPLRWRKPRRVFVNSMSDLFHQDVPDEFIARAFAVMAMTPQHSYQILTKRHGRMRSLLANAERGAPSWLDLVRGWVVGNSYGAPGSFSWPLRNVWLGCSVEDQKRADLRIPALLDTPAAVRFLSCEPLLSSVDLSPWLDTPLVCGCGGEPGGPVFGCSAECMQREPSGLGWIICGGESGPGARPMHPEWARSLRDQCQAAGVPFFFKQWGEWATYQTGSDYREPRHWVNEDGRVADEATALADGGSWHGVLRVGKKAAGRELDGRTHDAFPAVDAPLDFTGEAS
jgi:protein gp37